MDTDLQKKFDYLKTVNTDNSRFIVRIIESAEKNNQNIENQKKNSTIITNYSGDINNFVIDLDAIWSKPYFYTKMRLKFNIIISKIKNTNYQELIKNPKRFCNNLVRITINKNFAKPEKLIDIVDFIKSIKNKDYKELNSFIYIAKNLDEETLFKEEQIRNAIEIIKETDLEKRTIKVYDSICDYLNKDFISNKYCDFINNKCVAQRHFNIYPINKKNGCCFMEIRTCNHLKNNGSCEVECLACKLFACPYLSKKGVGYWASDFILLKSFFNKEQRKHVVFDFYKPKEYVINKILECEK